MGDVLLEASRVITVEDGAGRDWTVTTCRGNQWARVPLVDAVYRQMDRGTQFGLGILLPLVILLPFEYLPNFITFVIFHLRGREDWEVTVRAGAHASNRARVDVEHTEGPLSREDAGDRMRWLAGALRRDKWFPEGWRIAGPD